MAVLFCSAIFWSEMDEKSQGYIMKSQMNGNEVTPIFVGANSHQRVKRDSSCNCPDLSVTTVFAMDHTQKQDTELYIVEADTGSIWASDVTGCHCRRVVNGTGNHITLIRCTSNRIPNRGK